MELRIAIGADHRGFGLKEQLIKHQEIVGYHLIWHDMGSQTDERSDYPLFAAKVSKHILDGKADVGVLLCGTGTGMAMMANRFAGIYAGVVWNEEVARRAREEDGVNVVCLPTDYLDLQESKRCLAAWLSVSFRGGRYQDRLDLITQLAP